MFIYTNSPNTPDYITPGKLYEFTPLRPQYKGRVRTDIDGNIAVNISSDGSKHLDGDHWHILSDYHAKHLES